MTIPSFERRSFSETAVATTLASGISDTDTSITIASSTGWPSGSSGDFYIRIESEDIRVDTRTGTTLTVLSGGRGANGTTAAVHSSGVAVTLVFTSFDADEANYVVNETVGKITAAGQILVGDGANSLAAVQAKTSGQILVGDGSTVASVAVSGDATLASSGALTIANDAITSAKIAADAVGTSEIAADAVTSSEIAAGAVGTSELATGILPLTVAFTQAGTLTTGTGSVRFRFPFAATIQHIRLACSTAPTGAAILVDVNLNGTTIFTTQGNRPTIAISANSETATTAPDVTAVSAGDYITVDIDQVGSTVEGSDLVVVVYYKV